MTMSTTRTAVERGLRWIAGMLDGGAGATPESTPPAETRFRLVSWQTSTHSRRADEEARRAQPYASD
jgi:hypothetical protein